MSVGGYRFHRLLEGSWTPDLNDMVNPMPARPVPQGLGPLGDFLVIDAVIGSQLAGFFEFRIAAGGNDHFGAEKLGELQGEDRHPAGPQNTDRLTGL